MTECGGGNETSNGSRSPLCAFAILFLPAVVNNKQILNGTNMSKTRTALYLVFAALLMTVSGLAVIFHKGEKTLEPGVPFPQKLKQTVEIGSDREKFTLYHEDKFTAKYTLTDLPEGLTEERHYRKNGKLSQRVVRYPTKAIGYPGQIMLDAKFDEDGETPVSEDEYFSDGKPFKISRRSGEDKFTRKFFWPSGKLRRNEVYERYLGTEWPLISAEVFSETGSRLQVFNLDKEGTTKVFIYDPKGKIIALVTKTSGQTIEDLYRPDGKSVHKRVVREAYTSTVTTFDKKGKPLEERAFYSALAGGGMMVKYFQVPNTRTFGQAWMPNDGGIGMSIFGTVEFFANGVEKRTVTFAKDKNQISYIDSETVNLSDKAEDQPNIVRYFAEDGRLVRIVKYPGDGKLIEEKTYDDGKGPKLKVKVAPYLTAWRVYEPEPEPIVLEEAPTLTSPRLPE